MDKIYWMIFKNSKGSIEDIREAKYLYFFRKDGSFTSEIRRSVKECIKRNGSFTFKLKGE